MVFPKLYTDPHPMSHDTTLHTGSQNKNKMMMCLRIQSNLYPGKSHMTFHDSKVGKLGKVSKSNPPKPLPSAKAIFDPKESGPVPETPVLTALAAESGRTVCCCCCCWWSSRYADVSRVGKHPAPGIRPPGLWGSGFRIGTSGTCELLSLTPVTCCTMWRKLAASAAMKVVCDLFEARDFRLEILSPAVGIALRWRFLVAVSGSEPPERPETVGVAGAVSGFTRPSKGEAGSVGWKSRFPSVSDFSRALVRVSVSRAKASEIQESAKAERKVQGSRLAKFSEDAIIDSLNWVFLRPPSCLIFFSLSLKDKALRHSEGFFKISESPANRLVLTVTGSSRRYGLGSERGKKNERKEEESGMGLNREVRNALFREEHASAFSTQGGKPCTWAN